MSPGEDPYRRATRVLLRYAIVMTVVALLVGVSYRESTKKLGWDAVPAGGRVEVVLPLALVHGHLFVAAVLVPIALAGALHLARAAGGRDVSARTLRWSLGLYLPFATLTLVLQLVKAYHVLLAVRGGDLDLAAIDGRFLGGHHAVRYVVYGVTHGGMAIGLGVLLVALWRSLGARPA